MELFNLLQSSCEADFHQPLFDYLRCRHSGQTTPPYIPVCDLKPIEQLAKLALLWNEAGFAKEAGQLAHWLSPLRAYPTLWSTEKQFDERRSSEWMERLSSIQPIPGWSPDFSYTLLKSPFMSGVLTWAGNKTSLGVIRGKEGEIRAFGPQSPSFLFGIDGKGIDGWVRAAAYPEVWFEFKSKLNENELQIDFRFIGVDSQTPLALAFYAKGPQCQVGGELLKPKTLRRFIGEGKEARIGSIGIASPQTHKMEVIPLAGEGGFWNSDFLIQFEISPFNPQICFTIESFI